MSKVGVKQAGNTGNLKTAWKKGQSGNPHGRPKKEHCFSDIARELLGSNKIDIEYTFPKDGKNHTRKMHLESNKIIYYSLVTALIREGMDGSVPAIKELLDRTDGRSRESVAPINADKLIPVRNYKIPSEYL